MSNSESDGPSENEWDDRGELAWNEFDWENYLREQDEVLSRYLAFYEKAKGRSDRIDYVAHLMGWDEGNWSNEDELNSVGKDRTGASVESKTETDDLVESADADDSEPYTLHKNPIFIATKAIYFSLKQTWIHSAGLDGRIPAHLGFHFHASLCRGEEQATLAIQSLDFGDYALAISLFKRALRDLNQSFRLITEVKQDEVKGIQALRDNLFPRLFDLREIWLRVMNECRDELQRPSDEED